MTSFLRVDSDLLAAAAEMDVEDTGELDRFRSWVERLPTRQQQRWLLRAADSLDLAVGSALLGEFRRRIRRWPPSRDAPWSSCSPGRRNGGPSLPGPERPGGRVLRGRDLPG